MPYLSVDKFNRIDEQEKKIKPIAIVKSENKKSKLHNSFLYLDEDIKPNPDKKTKIQLPLDCKFQLLPNVNSEKRDVYYIAGASGSGKSYITRQIVNNYAKLYKHRMIFIVSQLDSDDTLDGIESKNIRRLDLKKLIANPPDINNPIFYKSFIIFDDLDALNKKDRQQIDIFINNVATMGRKHKEGQGCISMALISHYITNHSRTKLILNEATGYILFPQSTAQTQLLYILNKYLGFDRKDIRKLKKMGSRWILAHKNYPNYIIGEHTAEILHQDDD